ncbi:MAG: ATP phosphoribosyltransferase [Gammaproteobacteria bacterium 39-13]|nr:ATP phosphoribosyltransferase [Gammaproteobacteria bacterium]OJV85787.1 MAG: ATP phosphoribosyltransferase [Gammaproteobacteria bacterium 39-13]
MQANARLTIAIQKKGRLSEDSIALLQRCGLKLLSSKSSLFYSAENLPIDLLLVRDDDIPTLIRDKVCDLGIIGENVLQEQENAENGEVFDRVKLLGFGRCRLSIACPKESTVSSLQGKRIATSYPNLLNKYLNENNIDAKVINISGSVEIAPRLKMSEAICDLVSTGRTLEENNLKEVMVILQSQAVLVKASEAISPEKMEVYDLLLRRIDGVLQAQESKYILFHAPKNAINDIKKLLPGSEAPTIVPLAECNERVAVHVVSREGVFWSTLEKLRAAGASAILVLPVEKMMF